MTGNIFLSLQITLVGMSIVFVSIMILWLAMAILMRLTNGDDKKTILVEIDETELERERKKRAAISAVVVALAQNDENEMGEFPLPPTAFVSAWQAVMRSNSIRKRGQIR